MTYVSRDGRIVEKEPLSLNSIVRVFWGIIHFFICFFRGMFRLDEPSKKGQYGSGTGNSRFGNSNRRMGGFGRGVNTPAPPPCAPGGG